MDTRKVSAAVGFTLLMTCVIVVVMIIYNGGSSRTSYRTSMEESWKKRDISIKGQRQEVMGTNSIPTIITTSESTVQEAKKLADELQKLFTSKTAGGASHKRVSGRVTLVEEKARKTEEKLQFASKPQQSENIVTITGAGSILSSSKTSFDEMNSERPTSSVGSFTTSSSSSKSRNHHGSDDDDDAGNLDRNKNKKHATPPPQPPMSEELEKDSTENDYHYPTSGMPSINSRRTQKNPFNQLQLAGSTSTSSHPHRSNILLVKSSASASPQPSSSSSSTMIPPHDRVSSQRRHHHPSSTIPSQIGEINRHPAPHHNDDDERRNHRGRGPYSQTTPKVNNNNNRFVAKWGTEQEQEEEEDSEPDADYVTRPQASSSYGIEDSLKYNPRDPLKAMGNMLQLVTDVYKRGRDGLDVAGFLRVINETVQRSNNNNLLGQLNQMYARHGNWSAALFPHQKSEVVGRNALENSLSAFVFMSFGVFLLNQIHNFMGTSSSDGNTRQGRKLDYTLEDSELNFLFEPPPSPPLPTFENINSTALHLLNITDGSVVTSDIVADSTTTTILPANLEGEKKRDDDSLAEAAEKEQMLPMSPLNEKTAGNSSNISNYVNNMFRAGINLVNAYTTADAEALDCIWSKYCQDLDKISAEHGSLYSIAARINSVGLRLIKGQIPTELTVDVVLRSLLGWDGLPCVKMFSKCNLVHGQLLRETTTEVEMNRTDILLGQGL